MKKMASWTSEPIKSTDYNKVDAVKTCLTEHIKPFLTQFDNITYIGRYESSTNTFQDKYSISGYNNCLLCVNANVRSDYVDMSFWMVKSNLDGYDSTPIFSSLPTAQMYLFESVQTVDGVNYKTLSIGTHAFALSESNKLTCLSAFSTTDALATWGYVFEKDKDGNNISILYYPANGAFIPVYDRDETYLSSTIYRTNKFEFNSDAECVVQDILIKNESDMSVLTNLYDLRNTTFATQYMKVQIDNDTYIMLMDSIFIKVHD